MLILSHPTGNQNMRQAALALHQGGLLGEVWTCLGWGDDHPLAACLPQRLRAEAARRSFPQKIASRLRLRPWHELGRLAATRLGWRSLTAHERGPFCIDHVYRDLDRCVAAHLMDGDGCGMTGVYAYEDGAVASFRAAERLGLQRVYDLPIGYWRAFDAICREEREAVPAYAETLIGTLDSQAKRERKDTELALATTILVASTYTAGTLLRYPGRLLRPPTIIPYGCPPVHHGPRSWSTEGPLRVLFVGSLSQRKGMSYLFEALNGFGPHATLTVIGSRTRPCAVLEHELARHRYIPSLPHDGILAEMRQHDVLLFPSLFEGFGLVISEAMSQGLPVITTPNTAGPDIITDGVDGFIIPIRSVQAIAGHLDRLIGNRPLLRQLGMSALATAARRHWEDYRAGVLRALGQAPRPALAGAPP